MEIQPGWKLQPHWNSWESDSYLDIQFDWEFQPYYKFPGNLGWLEYEASLECFEIRPLLGNQAWPGI